MAYKNELHSHNSPITFNLTLQLPKVFFFLGVLSFVVSLFLDAFFTSEGNVIGGWVFIIGWMGILIFQFAWYANPLNLLALLIAESQPRVSILLSILALTIASDAFFFYEIPTGLTTGLYQEKQFIKELGIGFYCWYFAQILFLLAILSKYLVNRNR